MKIDEVNSILRNKILHLINEGWLKTHIGRVLLGSNGQAHLNHFLKEDTKSGHPNDFGVKPLQKIASVIGYNVRIVFVPKNQHETEEHLEQLNMHFIEDLDQSLINYLNNNVTSPVIAKSSRTQLDAVLDEILPVGDIEDSDKKE